MSSFGQRLVTVVSGAVMGLGVGCGGEPTAGEQALDGVAGALVAAASPKGPFEPGPKGVVRCATRHVDDLEAARVERDMRDKLSGRSTSGSRPGGGGGGGGSVGVSGGVVPMHLHIVTRSDGTGTWSQPMIDDQMIVLNSAFAPMGWSFSLATLNFVQNDQWFDNCGSDAVEAQMKNTLRVGSGDDLNVYSCDPLTSSGLLGWATFPWYYAQYPKHDGVVMLHSTVPGGSEAPYNGGLTLVHEVGHWIGLYHTFQGGCSKTNDSVGDTPAERSPAYGCPVARDTCLGIAGLDPTENFMDYTDDACMNRFSTGQDSRMDGMYSAYRLGK